MLRGSDRPLVRSLAVCAARDDSAQMIRTPYRPFASTRDSIWSRLGSFRLIHCSIAFTSFGPTSVDLGPCDSTTLSVESGNTGFAFLTENFQCRPKRRRE